MKILTHAPSFQAWERAENTGNSQCSKAASTAPRQTAVNGVDNELNNCSNTFENVG